MSASSLDTDATKKHRHDVGDPDHGPSTTERTTRTIQVLLGCCILASGALVVYAVSQVL